MKTLKITEMTWEEVAAAMSDGFDTVLFALGSTEQHGPALPEHTDTLEAEYIANRLALRLDKTLQGPTVNLGCSDHHLSFPGTISLRKETLQAILTDYVSSLAHHGFKKILIIPFHGGNFAPTEAILPSLRERYPEIEILAYTDLLEVEKCLGDSGTSLGYTKEEIGGHADAWESSAMLYLDEEHVHRELFTSGYRGEIGEKELARLFREGMTSLTENGILGDSRRAQKEDGKALLDLFVEFLYEKIRVIS